MTLVLATRNLHKIRELKALLKPLLDGVDILSLRDFSDYVPPEETGQTFQENAELKALHASSSLQQLTLSDDSGLCVPALDGKPGVFSARYAGKEATDKENCDKLLQEMESFTEEERTAYFSCTMTLSSHDQIIKSVTATCDGLILPKSQGRYGFGYDGLFLKTGYHKSFAELDEATKNRVSHRRKAFDKLALIIQSTIESLCSTS